MVVLDVRIILIIFRIITIPRGRMQVIQNGQQLEEVGCFKYLGSQVAADGGCERDVVHRMNEG